MNKKLAISVLILMGFLVSCKDSTSSPKISLNETWVVSTIAGSTSGFADGLGTAAQFERPIGVGVDSSGNIYVADYVNYRIRKITPAGEVSTFAGSGTSGLADGVGSAAQFHSPIDIAVDLSDNTYVVEHHGHRIRKITPAGEVSTFAGGTRGFADGLGTAARFDYPLGIAADLSGNIYVADRNNHRIRKITPAGEVSTVAGSTSGFSDGLGTAAQFDGPTSIAVGSSGNIYVTDGGNNRIREISPAGEVSTLAGSTSGFSDGLGSEAQFYYPNGIALDSSGNIYVTDNGNNRIREISPVGEVSTLAGSTIGFSDGLGSEAQFNKPSSIAVDLSDNIYVADQENHRIRKIEYKVP